MKHNCSSLHWFFCVFFSIFCTLGLLPKAHAALIADQWLVIKEAYFDKQIITEAQDKISLQAPAQAENAAVVPFSFSVHLKQATIHKIYVFTDANPILLTAILTPKAPVKALSLATRIRLERNSFVRVLVVDSMGRTFIKTTNIKTPGGGCGGGAMTDEAKLRALAGKMKMRLVKPKDEQKGALVLNIKHPMRTGFERTFQGYFAKAWFIQYVELKLNDKPYLNAELGPGISADPYLKLSAQAIHEKQVSVKLVDNEGKVFYH